MAPAAPKIPPPSPTRADLERLPENVVGQIIEGVLYTHPRPRGGHSNIEIILGSDLNGPFQRGRGGPGGWWILPEPGIELPGSPEFAPDLAGWRKVRLPAIPERAPFTLAPDWACEILSPSTRGFDQRIKRPFYARIGIKHLWFVDLEGRTLTISELRDGGWFELGVYGESDLVRAAPFQEVELALAEWWPPQTSSTT